MSQLASLQSRVGLQTAQISLLDSGLGKLRAKLQCLPLETFYLFQKLPLELRHQIWRYALPGPRLITLGLEKELLIVHIDRGDSIKISSRRSSHSDKTTAFSKIRQTSAPKIPELLHACRESRQLALAVYDFCLSTSIRAASTITETIWVPAPEKINCENQISTSSGRRVLH